MKEKTQEEADEEIYQRFEEGPSEQMQAKIKRLKEQKTNSNEWVKQKPQTITLSDKAFKKAVEIFTDDREPNQALRDLMTGQYSGDNCTENENI